MLFRDEVIRRKAERLHGSVVLGHPRSTTMIVVALSVLALGFLGFAVLGEYARSETVRGILTTDPPAAKVNIPRQGIVTTVHVEDGDVVQAGDPLLVVDTDVLTGEGGRIAASAVESLDDETTLQRRQSSDIRNSYRNASFQVEAQIADLESQITTFERQVVMQEGMIESNRGLFAKAEKVAARGFVSGVEIERRRQQLIQSEQQLASLRQQLSSTRAALQRAILQRSSIDTEMSRELGLLEASVTRLDRERMQLAGSKDFIVTSPIEGRVTALQLSQGQTATPGISALTVVPVSKTIEAEVFAPSRAIGLVREGQEVNLLIDAFPYQRFGNIDARVESVTATIIDPRQIDAPFKIEEPVFKIKVAIKEGADQLASRGMVLQPGMTLHASIVLERRSFLEWLLSPLYAVTRRNQ